MKSTKQVYLYDEKTKIYIGQGVAKLCPITKAVWHYPANSTIIAPPESMVGEICIFSDEEESWSVISDPRGKDRYNVMTKEYAGIVNDISDLDDEYTLDKPNEFDVWDKKFKKWKVDQVAFNTAKAKKPLEDWQRKMQESDNSLPRIAEDLMDIIISKGLVTKEELPAKVRLDYDNKKKIRAEKPK